MTREQRAKQFMPFDALKGLKEAIAVREERRSRTEKREMSEDQIEHISTILTRIESGMEVAIEHYRAFHDVVSQGKVQRLDKAYKFIVLNAEKIYFDDIYDILIKET